MGPNMWDSKFVFGSCTTVVAFLDAIWPRLPFPFPFPCSMIASASRLTFYLLCYFFQTPLLVAVTARQPAIVYDLIQAGADVNAVDNKGQSALHLAATYGYAQVLQVGQAFML